MVPTCLFRGLQVDLFFLFVACSMLGVNSRCLGVIALHYRSKDTFREQRSSILGCWVMHLRHIVPFSEFYNIETALRNDERNGGIMTTRQLWASSAHPSCYRLYTCLLLGTPAADWHVHCVKQIRYSRIQRLEICRRRWYRSCAGINIDL